LKEPITTANHSYTILQLKAIENLKESQGQTKKSLTLGMAAKPPVAIVCVGMAGESEPPTH